MDKAIQDSNSIISFHRHTALCSRKSRREAGIYRIAGRKTITKGIS